MKPRSADFGPANQDDIHRPTMLAALGEFRAPFEATMLWLNALTYPWPRPAASAGKTVMFIPGFMAGDITLAPLANFCRYLGHRAVMSGIWSNSDCPRDVLALLGVRLERVIERHSGPIVIVGHSLGGIYARELAHRYPHFVGRVITMGSPIRQVRQSANLAVQAVADSVAAIRGRMDGCLSEQCSCGITIHDLEPADVPTTAIYSRTDGIVDWRSCVDRKGSDLVENVEVHCSHVGMAVSAEVYKIIAARLARPARSTSDRASGYRPEAPAAAAV